MTFAAAALTLAAAPGIAGPHDRVSVDHYFRNDPVHDRFYDYRERDPVPPRHRRAELRYGHVIHVEPVYRWFDTPARERSCLRQGGEFRERRGHSGALIGAVVGGALGNRLGDGRGRERVGTIAGGLLGAAIGDSIGRRAERRASVRVDGPCRVTGRGGRRRELVAYRVSYRYDGRIYHTTMDHHPGDRIRLHVNVRPA